MKHGELVFLTAFGEMPRGVSHAPLERPDASWGGSVMYKAGGPESARPEIHQVMARSLDPGELKYCVQRATAS